MNPHLPRLIELQALDLRMAEIKAQRRQIPQRLDAAERPLQAVREAQKTAAETIESMTKERRASERELDAQEAQIEKMRGRTSEIKTNKEYQAHLFEIELASKKKSEIEERVLELMEQIESVQKRLVEAHANVAEAERTFAQGKKDIEESETRLIAELADLESRHRAATEGVPEGLLSRYVKLKLQRKDQALAALREGICQGCRLQLPPQLVAEVKRSDALQTCDYCHRILYWEGQLPGEASAATRVARAQDDEDGESL